jgi:hypothetical protein
LSTQEVTTSKYQFCDLGIDIPATASSKVAATLSFPLFTSKAIPLIRKSLLNPRYLNKTAAIFGPKIIIIRNTAAYSPFFRSLWTHPLVIERLSQAAGVKLEPVMDTMELGHANVQFDTNQYYNKSRNEILDAVACELTDPCFCSNVEKPSHEVQRRSPEELSEAIESTSLIPWQYVELSFS